MDMTIQSLKVETTAITVHPLETLYLSPLNPRQDVSDDEIAALATSIQTCGMIQNLSGLETSQGIAIVAGGRRLRALQLLARDGLAPEFIPVRLAKSEDEACAIALAENTARADLDPADEIIAYGRMELAGASIGVIASAFAVTEAHVRRRLKLARLPEIVLVALKARLINLDQAAAFTLCEDAELLNDALENAANHNWNSNHLTRFFTDKAASSTDRRAIFVGIDAFQSAGGLIAEDLFSSKVYLHGTDLLDRLFAEKLAAQSASLIEEGWKWAMYSLNSYVDYNATASLTRIYPSAVQLSEAEAAEYEALSELSEREELTEDQEARLEALEALQTPKFSQEQKEQAGGIIFVDYSGNLRAEMGYVRPEHRKEATEAGVLSGNYAVSDDEEITSTKANRKSPFSPALVADMQAARLASIQGALLAKPELALDLLAFTLDLANGDFSPVLSIRAGAPVITPSVAEGFSIDPRLTKQRGHGYQTPTTESFVAYQALGKKARNAALTTAISRSLTYALDNRGTVLDHIAQETNASLRHVWTPTAANFFGRVPSAYLDTLLADLLGIEATDDRLKSFVKMKKSDKARTFENLFSDETTQKLYALTPDQIERLKTWVPDCL